MHAEAHQCSIASRRVVRPQAGHAHRYQEAPEPQLPGHSVTIRPSAAMVQQLHWEAPRVFNAPLARVMQATEVRAIPA